MFNNEPLKIIPGGINLVAPGDSLPEGDCIKLKGWWPGSAGRLEQAPDRAIFATGGFGETLHSICQNSGQTYFGGQNGALYERSRGTIDTGYDGYPLGMIGYQGYLWAMNRTKQRRDNGTTVSDWTPAPPGVPALSNPSLTSSTLTIAELDPANPDATTGDYLLIRMWTPSSIAELEVGALMTIAGAGAFNGTWQVTAIYNGAPNSLIEMAAQVPSGTSFTTAGGMTATFANPSVPMGDYEYWVTWAYTDLGESNPSSSAGVITPATQTVGSLGTKNTISIAFLSPPAGAAYWNVYRKGPGLPSPYRVNIDPIPIGTTTYDDFGDAAHSQDSDYLINALGILMEGDHDPAPAARIVANQVYNGRILVANSAAHPNRIWYTPPLQPGFFRGSGNPQSGDWVDIGTDRGDEILFMAVKPGQVTIYRAKSIWRHIGDFGDANARIEVAVPDLGIVGPRAVASTSLGDYFRSTEGVYKFNGDWAAKVSTKLDPIFRGLEAGGLSGESASYRVNCALGFRAGRLWVSYTAGAAISNTNSFILHVESDRWFSSGSTGGAFLDSVDGFLAPDSTFVYKLEAQYSGNTILEYRSRYEDCGAPDREKTWGDLVINHNTSLQTLEIYVLVNDGTTGNDSILLDTVIGSTSRTKSVIPLVYPAAYPVVELRGEPIRSFNLAVHIQGGGAVGSPVVIESPILLHYYIEARKGKTFDTGPTDHGYPDVKTIDEMEVDIDAPADCRLLIRGDTPGGVIVNQLTQTVSATTGRQIRRLVLSNAGSPLPLDGKLFRDLLTSTADFHVYAFRVRALPIGVYLDGTVGDFWDSEPIPIGV